MSLIFDAVIIAICAFTVVMGAKKGFVKSIMNLGSNIASLFIAYAFHPRLSVLIKDTYLQKALSDGIASTIKALSSSGAGANTVTYDLSKLFSEMPDAFTQILNRYNTDYPELQSIYGGSSGVSEPIVDSLAEAISSSAAGILSNIAAFTIIYFGAMAVLTIITWILDAIFNLPVLKTANTFLGTVFGVICAIFLACILSIISIHLIEVMTSVNPSQFNNAIIQNSVILKFFNENNLLSMITLK